MANSANWVGHAALSAMQTLLTELVEEGHVDEVTLDPQGVEWSGSKRFLYLRLAGGNFALAGMSGTYSDVDRSLLIRCYGTQSATEGVALALERLIALVIDKIQDNLADFHSLDPPCQVEGFSVVDDPAFSSELDLSAATLEVTIRNHGRS